LEATVRNADLHVERSGYFDHLSYLPYLLSYRLLGLTDVGEGSVQLFDKVLVPLSRTTESVAAKVPGKNVFAIATVGTP